MRPKLAGLVLGLSLLALPPASLAGHESSAPGAKARGDRGGLVAKDSAKKRPAAAVARVTLADFGKVSYAITSSQNNLPVDWGITVRCVKGSLIDYFPGPGDFRTSTKKTAFDGSFPVPLADPDSCTFAVAAQIARNDLGKRINVRIYNRRSVSGG